MEQGVINKHISIKFLVRGCVNHGTTKGLKLLHNNYMATRVNYSESSRFSGTGVGFS